MGLIYLCDCGRSKSGTPFSGINAEIADCLPSDWGICAKKYPAKILCGRCYTGHKH